MEWYKPYLTVYEKPYSQAPKTIIEEVKEKIGRLQSSSPLVTVSVIGYNEEKHLLACLWSLSNQVCKYPMEIIGVDNDSIDCTAQIFQDTHVPYYTETQHSCGWARSCGLAHAKGKYHINIDSDTLYPPHYVETMVDALKQKNVVGASSLWSYIPDQAHPRWQLRIYEFTRDCYLFLQSFKRPEMSVRGMVFAYHTQLAQKVGIRTHIIRGEDGALAFGLREYGKLYFVRKRKARAVTGYGTVSKDGTLFDSFKVRVIKGLKNISSLFTSKTEYIDEESNLIVQKNENSN